MRARWLFAVVACSGLAWAGIVYGACPSELLQKLLDRGLSNDDILRLCGQVRESQNAPSRPLSKPPEQRESQKARESGWLGVELQSISPYLRQTLSLENTYGALVVDVTSNSPAQKAGIQRGDVIVGFNGNKIQTYQELSPMVAAVAPGAAVPVDVLRSGKELTILVTLGTLAHGKEASAQLQSSDIEQSRPQENNNTSHRSQSQSNIPGSDNSLSVSTDETLKIIMPWVTGGLAGSLVTWFFTRRRQQVETALKIIDYYLSMFSEYAEVRGLLKVGVSVDDPAQQNRVIKFIMWFDVVAALWKKRLANKRVLRAVGFDQTIISFRQAMEDKSKEVNVFDDAVSKSPYLKGLTFPCLC